MLRRIFSICIVLGLLLPLLLAATSQGSAQALTPTSPPVTFPQADFVATPLSGAAPLTVQFTPLYTIAANSTPINYCYWAFGDGTSQYVSGSFSTCPAISHVYTTTRNFTVKLAVTITDMVFLVTKTDYIQVGILPPSATPVSTISDVPGPDLMISSITYMGSNPVCMNNPRDDIVVTNIGSVAAGTFYVGIITDNLARTPQVVNGLGAGQSVTLSVYNAVTVTAIADWYNAITETNETNNRLTATLPIPTQAPPCTPGTPLTPTRTSTTGPTLTRTRTPTTGPSLTLTRTPTAGASLTLTPSPGASRTSTPTLGTGPTCPTLTGTITAPFTFDDAGTFCWQSTNLGSYANSWNLATLTINGISFTNVYVAAASYPAKFNGYWYVYYVSAAAYGHFEAK